MKTFTCIKCGTAQDSELLPKAWFQIQETETKGIRLYEEAIEDRYETFHVPNKKIVYYCSRKCALDTVKSSMDVFLSEISTKITRGRVGTEGDIAY